MKQDIPLNLLRCFAKATCKLSEQWEITVYGLRIFRFFKKKLYSLSRESLKFRLCKCFTKGWKKVFLVKKSLFMLHDQIPKKMTFRNILQQVSQNYICNFLRIEFRLRGNPKLYTADQGIILCWCCVHQKVKRSTKSILFDRTVNIQKHKS